VQLFGSVPEGQVGVARQWREKQVRFKFKPAINIDDAIQRMARIILHQKPRRKTALGRPVHFSPQNRGKTAQNRVLDGESPHCGSPIGMILWAN